MTKNTPYVLAALRIALGVVFLYAGVAKAMDPAWSAAGYLANAGTLPGLYAWFASPAILPVVNFLNVWGAILIGSALILGIGVRVAAVAGALMMALYYLPILDFPKVGEHSFLVDQHVVYALALLLLASLNAGRTFGLGGWAAKRFARNPGMRKLLG